MKWWAVFQESCSIFLLLVSSANSSSAAAYGGMFCSYNWVCGSFKIILKDSSNTTYGCNDSKHFYSYSLKKLKECNKKKEKKDEKEEKRNKEKNEKRKLVNNLYLIGWQPSFLLQVRRRSFIQC